MLLLQAVGVESNSSDAGKRSCNFDLAHFKENMSVESPITDSRITDWDLLENIWEHAMARYLKADIKESPILISEKPFNPPSARQRYMNDERRKQLIMSTRLIEEISFCFVLFLFI